MTHPPEDRPPEEPTGSSDVEPEGNLDEDAAWASIVANYGDRPAMGHPLVEPNPLVEPVETNEPNPLVEPVETTPPDSLVEPVETTPLVEPVETTPPETNPPRRNLFDRSFIEATTEQQHELNSAASWDDEGHFVPPPPPPLPVLDPRRKWAWIGLFGAPALMLLGIVMGWHFPSWFSALLVGGFVGGFVYLVATMSRTGRGHWPGDDGAVV